MTNERKAVIEKLEQIIVDLRKVDLEDYESNDYLYDAQEALRKAINRLGKLAQ